MPKVTAPILIIIFKWKTDFKKEDCLLSSLFSSSSPIFFASIETILVKKTEIYNKLPKLKKVK